MKIQKIRLKNIHSLRGDWLVAFCDTPLSEAGLFAITGPTGAGKSTILDAITLALFNQTPRLGKLSKTTIEKAGAILTQHENEGFAEIEYISHNGHYRSRWSIRKTRTGNLDDYKMELTDLISNKILDISSSRVPAENENLIGLTYDQFIKSILLSQGQFAKFLQSDEHARSKLLEDLTGAYIYRELGKRAYEKFKEKNTDIQESQKLIESEEKLLLGAEAALELQQRIDTTEKDISDKEKEKNTIEKLIDTKEKIEAIDQEIEQYEHTKKKEEKEQHAFNTIYQPSIEKHRSLLPYIKELRTYQTGINAIQDLEQHINDDDKKFIAVTTTLKTTLDAIRLLTNQEVNETNAITHLNQYRTEVTHFIAARNIAQSHYDTQYKRATRLTTQLSELKKYQTLLNAENIDLDILKITVATDIISIEKEIQQYHNIFQIKEEQINAYKAVLENRKNALKDIKNEIISFRNNKQKIANLQKQIADIDGQLQNDEPTLLSLENEQQQIETKIRIAEKEKELFLLRQSLDDKRKQLIDNEPCPLCGALHHPYANQFSSNTPATDDILHHLKQNKSEIKSSIEQLKSKIDRNHGERNHLQKTCTDTKQELEYIKQKIDTFKEQLAISEIKNVQIIDDLINENNGAIDAIATLEKRISEKNKLSDFKQEIDALHSQSSDLNRASDALQKIYKGKDINIEYNTLHQQFIQYTSAIESIKGKKAANEQELQKQQININNIELLIKENIVALGYADLPSALRDVMEENKYLELDGKQRAVQNTIKEIQLLQDQAIKKKAEEILQDDPSKNKAQLLALYEQTTQLLQQKREEIKNLFVQKEMNEERKFRIETALATIEQAKKANRKWELLKHYIGDKEGKDFSTFAQGLTQKRLIALANLRLKKLNDRYLLDMPKPASDNELMVIDAYLGDEKRSVKTLSGGETFIVSLAMALGLSDLASGNIKLESLFIDEGFGSLDAETLDTAISKLEQLQMESNKKIGIISHVEALQERITTQIQLEKGNNGFSKITIKSNG